MSLGIFFWLSKSKEVIMSRRKRMKNSTFVLLLILIFQSSYAIVPLLAQNKQDAQEIKKVIEKFTESFAYHDLDSTMNQVSMNYSCTTCSDAKDYNTFKFKVQKRMREILETYAGYSISERRLNNLDIQDNNATVEAEVSWEGFNLDTLKEDSEKIKMRATLTKENGSWKITKLQYF